MSRGVILVHGYGEHAFRPHYDTLAQVISEGGWSVHRHVIRGHWTGDEHHVPTYYYNSFKQILADLAEYIAQVKAEYGYERVVLVGKSLGGLLAIRCLEEEIAEELAGVVALSPCLAIGSKYDTPVKRAIAYFITEWLGWSWFYSPWDKLQPSDVTRNAHEYESDPRILSKGVYASIAVSTRNETFLVSEKKHEIRKELLILHGGLDEVCAPGSALQFTRDLPAHCTTHIYPDSVHDLLDEPPEVSHDVHEKILTFLASFT